MTFQGIPTKEDGVQNAAGYHFHNWYGFGAVDAHAAVEAAKNYTPQVLDELVVTDWADTSGTSSLELVIPDFSTTGVSDTLNVTEDLIIEALQIRLTIDHPFISDLGIELTSPSGTISVLMYVNSSILPNLINKEILLSNAFYGEKSPGTWTLRIIDGNRKNIGKLKNWEINIFGRRELELKCNEGHLESCVLLGGRKEKEGDTDEAETLYKKACDGKNMQGCVNLGLLKEANNRSDARALYEKACDSRNSNGCTEFDRVLGLNCNSGDFAECVLLGGRKEQAGNIATAKVLYKKACDGGNGSGCTGFDRVLQLNCNGGNFAECVILGGRKEQAGNIATAKVLYKKACDGGNGSGCTGFDRVLQLNCNSGDFAECVLLGGRKEQAGNIATAKVLYKKSCDGNNMWGCIKLGLLKEPNSRSDARALYKKACDGGNSDGCTEFNKVLELNCNEGRYTECFLLGEHKEKEGNIEEASIWYKKSCDGNNTGMPPTKGCIKIGFLPKNLGLEISKSYILYENGEVYLKDIKVNLGTTNGVSNLAQAITSSGSGSFHSCVILKNKKNNHGSVKCWGKNGWHDRLGVGDTNDREVPTYVDLGIDDDNNPYTAKMVVTGSSHICALLNDDTVKCWGYNAQGQIGGGPWSGITINSGTEGDPLSGKTAIQIAAGGSFTCAILNDKNVKCWGNNSEGQTGGGTPNLGVGKTATKIVAGEYHACAILNDESVKCWGRNLYGQADIPNLGINKTITQIVAGPSNTCAILNDESVKCWGATSGGVIGGGSFYGFNTILRGNLGDPLSGKTAIQIATGYGNTCAILSDKSIKCWGSDGNRYIGSTLIGSIKMKQGLNGQGRSMGETGPLTTRSIPSATSLEKDPSGEICKLTLSDGNPSSSWTIKEYTTPITYNIDSPTSISDAIDNLITAIGPITWAGSSIILSKKDNDKIEANVDIPILDSMTLNIHHNDDRRKCSNPAITSVVLRGGNAYIKSVGHWIITKDFIGGGDKIINLDSVSIDLETSSLTKEQIADKVVMAVNDDSWTGHQYKTLPYKASKIDGTNDSTDNCPNDTFCVVFTRIFPGTDGNNSIPFTDSDYE